MIVRRTTTRAAATRDRGSVLVLCLVFILIAGFFVVPMLSYASAVLKKQGIVQTKNSRTEAVEGGLRVALYDTSSLYDYCSTFGPTQLSFSNLAETPSAPGIPGLESHCATIATGSTNVPGEQRYALATTQLQSQLVIPAPDPDDAAHPETNGTIFSGWCTSKLAEPPVPCGRPYPNSGLTADGGTTYDPTGELWQLDMTRESVNDQVFLPWLPSADTDTQPASGFRMPSWHAACRVFFPGTYIDDVTITGPDPVYFVSGIYYFQKTLKITGGASVVVGAGAAPGCVDSDSIAALEAEASPGIYPNKDLVDGSTGVGGTFVFGKRGRLVIDNSTGGDINFRMNRRVQQSTKPEAVMNDVSIMTVDGVTVGNVTSEYHRETTPGIVELDVPAGQVFTVDADKEPTKHGYSASTLISAAAAPVSCASATTAAMAADCPVVNIDLTTGNAVTIDVPGYVSVPQGSFYLRASNPTAKDVSFGGGVLAAQVAVGPSVPDSLQIGIVQAVVQRTFKVTTRTTSGSPVLQATAIVQVNQTGGYAINSYTIEQL